MTAPTLLDRQLSNTAAPRAEAAPVRLSTAGWSRLRRSVTTAVFVVATLVGVTVGVRAVDLSPVEPPVAIGQSVLQSAVQPTAPTVVAPSAAPVVPPTAPAVGAPTAPAVVPAPGPVDNGGGRGAGSVDGPGRGGGADGGGGGRR